MKVGSLFTGYGGLDLATESAFNGRTVWTSDTAPGASKIITARFPDAPNLGDITAIDWTRIEPVDIITAGWPCQPFSVAGKQKGAADDRALWPEVARAIRALRPRYVVLENVAAITTVRTGPEIARAIGSLAALGYVGSWLRLRASDVGAPHGRARIFIVATADTRGQAGDIRTGLRTHEPARIGRGRPRDSSGTPALLPTPDATHGRKTSRTGPLLAGAVELLPTPRATDGTKGAVNASDTTARRVADGQANLSEAALHLLPTPLVGSTSPAAHGQISGQFRRQMDEALAQFGQYAAAIDRWVPVIGRPAPDPTVNGRLNPRFVEWMMGLPEDWICGVPGLTRAQKLTTLGNGVVPQQAYAAIAQQIGGLP